MSEQTPQPNTINLAHQVVDALYDRAGQLPDADTQHFSGRSESGHRITVPLEENKTLFLERGTENGFGGDVKYTKISITGGESEEEHPIVRVGDNQFDGKYVASKTVAFKGRYGTERVASPAEPSKVLRAIHSAIATKEKESK